MPQPHTGHRIHNRALHPLRSAAPLMRRCTRSERVHCLQIGCTAHTNKPKRGHARSHKQAVHRPPLRRTTWRDVALLTRQRNAPHLAQHSHSQAQTRRASQPHRALHPLRGATPVTWHCTSYVALHPFRTGALPTYRVQHPHSQVKPWNKPPRTPTSTQRNDRSTSTRGRQYPMPRHVSELPDRGLNSFRI